MKVTTPPLSDFTRAKLPPTPPALLWSVEFSGKPTIRKVVLASSFAEAQNG